MGLCLGRRRAERVRHVPLHVEEAPTPWKTDPWTTDSVWQAADDAVGDFDVIALYTSECVYGPDYCDPVAKDEMIESICTCIDQLNEAFGNSQVVVRARLVAIMQFAVPLPWLSTGMYRDALLGEAASDQQRLARRQDPTPPELEEHYASVRRICLELRAQYRAHVVLLVTDSFGGGDPITGAVGATTRDEAFAIVPHKKVLDEYAPSHEIGHLFGCEHDPGHAIVRPGASCYGYVGDHWRTIMAYNPHNGHGERVVAHFSNPTVTYQDGNNAPEPTGTANANNAGQINAYAARILALRG